MKVVALDYGRARTGLAVSDATGTLARPAGIVQRVRSKTGRAELIRRIQELEAERVVVGMPVSLSGQRTSQTGETQAFVDELRAVCPVPVETFDERFTTALAVRMNGTDDDAVAAAHLLKGYLDRCAG
ncbi:MAG: Holliday junction resolvase RuvX [Gaiellales bacterium]